MFINGEILHNRPVAIGDIKRHNIIWPIVYGIIRIHFIKI